MAGELPVGLLQGKYSNVYLASSETLWVWFAELFFMLIFPACDRAGKLFANHWLSIVFISRVIFFKPNSVRFPLFPFLL